MLNRHMPALATCIVMLALSVDVGFQSASAQSCSDSLQREAASGGVLFNAGILTTGSSVGRGDQEWLGVGWALSERLRVTMLFHTGHQQIHRDLNRPVDGALLLGGASLEALYRVAPVSLGKGSIGVGTGLFTVLSNEGQGYNGGTAYVVAAFVLPIGGHLEIGPIARAGRWWWPNTVGDPPGKFSSFSPWWWAAGLTATFRPSLGSGG
jgi:hypothetical protein